MPHVELRPRPLNLQALGAGRAVHGVGALALLGFLPESVARLRQPVEELVDALQEEPGRTALERHLEVRVGKPQLHQEALHA